MEHWLVLLLIFLLVLLTFRSAKVLQATHTQDQTLSQVQKVEPLRNVSQTLKTGDRSIFNGDANELEETTNSIPGARRMMQNSKSKLMNCALKCSRSTDYSTETSRI